MARSKARTPLRAVRKKRIAPLPFEMQVFLAVGEAKAKNSFGCKAGDLHSLLIFSRQPAGGAPDEALARKGAAFAGWRHVKLERARRLEGVPQEQTLRAAYEDALAIGCSVVADRRSLNPPPRKFRKRDRRNTQRRKEKVTG